MVAMAEVTLFTARYSLFAQRVQIALTEKEIPFELINVEFRNKPQALLDANPIHKKVPAIVHKGKPVAESLVILEYLEDAFPEQVPLLPKDAHEKSKVRFWTDYIYQRTDYIYQSFSKISIYHSFSKISVGLRDQPETPEKLAFVEVSVTFLKTIDSAMTSFCADGPFFTGDKFGYLDVVLAPLCSTLGIIETLAGGQLPGPGELRRFYRWVEVVKAHPSVSSSLPSGEEILEFLKAMFSKLSLSTPK